MALTKWTIKHTIPVLCNGANMLFSREAFFSVDGYEENESVSSGDDVFLLQKFMRHGKKAGYVEQTESTVFTTSEQTVKGFFNQRIRWASKTSSYKNKSIKTFLLFVYALNLGAVSLLLTSISGFTPVWFLISFFSLKFTIDTTIIYPQAKFFQQRKLLFAMPLWEIMHIFYVVIIGFLSLRKSYIWKERIIKG